MLWQEFKKRKSSKIALGVILLFSFIGLYAPFFASSKPIALIYQGKLYFPLFRYLFYPGFFTKPIDLFYNLLMFTLPIGLLLGFLFKKRRVAVAVGMSAFQILFFSAILMGSWKNPERNVTLEREKKEALKQGVIADWGMELRYMDDYAKLNLLLNYIQRKEQDKRLAPYIKVFEKNGKSPLTLFASDEKRFEEERAFLKKNALLAEQGSIRAASLLPELTLLHKSFQHGLLLSSLELKEQEKQLVALQESPTYFAAIEEYKKAQKQHELLCLEEKIKASAIEEAKTSMNRYKSLSAKERFIVDKRAWEKQESGRVHILLSPFFRPFHWEDDAGGGQALNKVLPWWELTRVNRKDLTAALLFGIRISLVVGVTAVTLALLIGIPLGVVSGYFAGKLDILICRWIEIWEAMPAFFMLLLIMAILQSKSLFLVILILAVFGWTHFTRYIRGEVLKQRNLPYVLAGHALGFSNSRIMFSHVLPNAIPPILTLLPFSIMAAITSEAGLSFLGLGEEGSTSWGVLMAEGRSVFPGESYLLWPPAILLTILLVSIALVGDAMRDVLDPKMRH